MPAAYKRTKNETATTDQKRRRTLQENNIFITFVLSYLILLEGKDDTASVIHALNTGMEH